MDTLHVIEQEVRACTLCRLSSNRRNAVAGEGLGNAIIMLIGEAPGAKEDNIGRPFVGSAGKVLDQALMHSGLRRDHVFITNVVKCRPPNNRKPRRDEIYACMNYLRRQIRVVRPKIICLLGKTAHDAVVGGMFKDHRGRFMIKYIDDIRCLCFTTYHPAAVIYNATLRSILLHDMKNIAGLLIMITSYYHYYYCYYYYYSSIIL
jgi:DNA polymerase